MTGIGHSAATTTIDVRSGHTYRAWNRDLEHASFVDVAVVRYELEPNQIKEVTIPIGVDVAVLGIGVSLEPAIVVEV